MRNDLYTHIDAAAAGGPSTGPDRGCRVCIQPALNVRGWPTKAASLALKGNLALEDAFVVERLRRHGHRIAASVHMSELGFGLAGDTTGRAIRADGGAALVADAFGESRIIAAAHGLLGFKPSQGLVSRRGMVGLIPSMETLAVVAADVRTLAAIIAAIIAPDRDDFAMLHAGLPTVAAATADTAPRSPLRTIGVITSAVDTLGAAAKSAFRSSLRGLAEKGFTVRELAFPEFSRFSKVHQIVGAVEASSSTGRFDSVRYGHRAKGAANWNEMYLRSRAESFGTLLKGYLFQGAHFQFNDYPAFVSACRIRRRLVEEVDALFTGVDVLALPVRQDAADVNRTETVADVYSICTMTVAANVLRTPAVSIPGPAHAGDDDPGLQLLAPRIRDRELLEMAAAIAG